MVRWIGLSALILIVLLRCYMMYQERGNLRVGVSVKIIKTITRSSFSIKGKKFNDVSELWVQVPKNMELEVGDRVWAVGKLQSQVTTNNVNQLILVPSRIYKQEGRKNYGQVLKQNLLKWLPGDEGALAVGLLFGGTGYLSRSTTEEFRRAGISHVLAASGYNVSLVAGWLLVITTRFLGRRWGLVAGVVGVWVYVYLAGPTAAVVRAAVMASAVVVGSYWGREADVGWWLVISGVMMAIVNPLWMVDIGFQLSFAAMAGLVWLTPLVPEWVTKKFLMAELVTTLAAQVATMPLIVHYFGNVSVVAPVTNLAVIWMVPPAMQILAIATLVGLVWFEAGQVVVYLAWPLLRGMIGTTSTLGNLPIAAWDVGKIGWMWVILAYCAMVLGVIYIKRRQEA